MERDRIKFKSNVEGKIQFMNKLCTVKIDWCHLDLFGNKEIEKSETKLLKYVVGTILEDLNSLYVIDFLLQPQK